MLYQDTVFTKLRTEDGVWTNKALQSLYKFMLLENPHVTKRAVGGGFPEAIVKNDIIPKLDTSKKETARILIFNDLQLILYNELLNAGYNQNNIYLCYNDWLRKETNIVYTDIMNVYIESNFRDYETILHNYVSLEEAINLSQQTKFDYIIANPPFQKGNDITRFVMENVAFDSYINLMPASKYKKQNLFEKVVSVNSAQDCFEDALVGESLILCVLKNQASTFTSYETFEVEKMDPRFRNYYLKNLSYPCKYPYTPLKQFSGDEAEARATAENYLRDIFNSGYSFYVPMRTVLDGAHRTANCFDYQWNVSRTFDFSAPVSYIESLHCSQIAAGFITGLTEICQKHLCDFWYKNPLWSELLWGLHKTGGTASTAIPNIDFSKNRDYEHCTVNDLMRWLDEDNDKHFSSYEEFSNEFRDPRFVDFYALNASCENRYPYACAANFFKGCDEAAYQMALRKMQEYQRNIATSFCITWRTVLDGAHRTANCYDYKWNVLETASLESPIHVVESQDKTCITVDFITGLTPLIKKNLCRFWYNNPLCCELIWGLNKSSGTASPAIPNVDFSKDRDWEHCTLEDLMNWLREDNELA